jgi:hypothetical protein
MWRIWDSRLVADGELTTVELETVIEGHDQVISEIATCGRATNVRIQEDENASNQRGWHWQEFQIQVARWKF